MQTRIQCSAGACSPPWHPNPQSPVVAPTAARTLNAPFGLLMPEARTHLLRQGAAGSNVQLAAACSAPQQGSAG